MHIPHPSRLGRVLALAAALALTTGVTSAAADVGRANPAKAPAPAAKPATLTGAKPEARSVCPPATKDAFTCFALQRTDIAGATGLVRANTAPAGFGPSDLLSAYNLPADGGAGATVAIVDAYDDPNAEADLGLYRTQFGLPACTTANGCFKKVDQTGGTSYPTPDAGWSGEISLDLDMVSAIAPRAHIILVEAATPNFTDLGASVDEAVALGAGYVSNSYGSNYTSTPGSGEDPSEATSMDPYYNHPGVAVIASSGDGSYGVAYPAASQYVTSVGGTSLVKDTSARGWSESVWSNSYGGPGSGCSLYEPKPSFQKDTGCTMRTVADVSAVADPATGVSVYDTYQATGWQVYGGTSVSAPLISGVYADAGAPGAGTYPNAYPYAKPSSLNDVTQGSTSTCTPAYLCTAGPGYDGPTGLGTPNGLAAFSSGPHGLVSGKVTDGTNPVAGAEISAGTASTTTAADGSYSLSVTPGTYTIGVSAFGYADQSVDGVVVADGATVAENFTLAAVARVAVTGKVTDGSGQGWPLYATISVDGMPGGPVYTNPKTGAYSIQLPVNKTYQLHTTAAYPGYQPTDTPVTVGVSAVSQPISVKVDPATCTAVGYHVGHTGQYQTFDGTTAPAGWTVTDNTASGGWEFDDPGKRGNLTTGAGGFAIVDSDHLGTGNSQDTYLTSPVADLSGVATPELDFATYYKPYGNSTATVEVSVDNGATWSAVWSQSTTAVTGTKVSVPLPQAVGKTQVQVRFHYTGTWAYYWEVDNVLIGTPTCDPVSGGLVIGQVTDANTKGPLAGVSVSETAAPTVGGTSAATADPAMKGAFYWFFSPTTGSVPLTAAKGHYTAGTATAAIAKSKVVEADFSLKAGRLAVTPGSVSKTVAWGGNATQTVTVKNTGTAPATLNVSEQPGGFVMQDVPAAPTQIVPAHVTTGSALVASKKPGAAAVHPTATTSGDNWQPLANFPTLIQDNIADFAGGKLYSGFGFDGTNDSSKLYSFDPVSGAWTTLASATDTRESPAHGFIGGKLYVVGGVGHLRQPRPEDGGLRPGGEPVEHGPGGPDAVRRLRQRGDRLDAVRRRRLHLYLRHHRRVRVRRRGRDVEQAGRVPGVHGVAVLREPGGQAGLRRRDLGDRGEPEHVQLRPGNRGLDEGGVRAGGVLGRGRHRRQRQAAGDRRCAGRRPDQPVLGLRPGGRRLVGAAELQHQRLPLRRRAGVLHGRRRPGNADAAGGDHAGAARLHHRPVDRRAVAVGERHDADPGARRLGDLPGHRGRQRRLDHAARGVHGEPGAQLRHALPADRGAGDDDGEAPDDLGQDHRIGDLHRRERRGGPAGRGHGPDRHLGHALHPAHRHQRRLLAVAGLPEQPPDGDRRQGRVPAAGQDGTIKKGATSTAKFVLLKD